MSQSIRIPATGLIAFAAVIACGPASAVQVHRQEVSQPSGQCVSSRPTDTVIHRAGSMRNGGAVPLYFYCGLRGDYRVSAAADGASEVGIVIANTDTKPKTVQCTLHVGYSASSTTTNRGSYAQSSEIAAGGTHTFAFVADDYIDGEWATPTFVCRIDPKVEVRYAYREYDVEVGL